MTDQSVTDSLASKFQLWAESLSPAEQSALGEWLAELAGVDVAAHWDDNWWQQPGAWSRVWADSWQSR